jgi:hypothetical protein
MKSLARQGFSGITPLCTLLRVAIQSKPPHAPAKSRTRPRSIGMIGDEKGRDAVERTAIGAKNFGGRFRVPRFFY